VPYGKEMNLAYCLAAVTYKGLQEKQVNDLKPVMM